MNEHEFDQLDRQIADALAPLRRINVERRPPGPRSEGITAPRRPRAVPILVVGAALLAPIAAAVALVVTRSEPVKRTPVIATATVTTPPALSAIEAAMLGSWVPEAELQALATAEPKERVSLRTVDFEPDGTFRSSDPCHATGTWSVDDGRLTARTTASDGRCAIDPLRPALAGTSQVVIRDGALIIGTDSATQLALRRADAGNPPDPPTAGWLPGYSSFAPTNVVTDRSVVHALGELAQHMLDPDPGPFFAWRLGTVRGQVFYLVASPKQVCVHSLDPTPSDSGIGQEEACTVRYPKGQRGQHFVYDPFRHFGTGNALVISDDVATFTYVRPDGSEAPAIVARDHNFAFTRQPIPLDGFRYKATLRSGAVGVSTQ